MAHLTQDSTFTLGRRLAGLIYADKAKSFGGYTLLRRKPPKGGFTWWTSRAKSRISGSFRFAPGVMRCCCRTVIWVITAATALQRTSIRRGISGTAATSEVTPDNEIVWHYEDIYHHHDAQWLANGNLLYTAASPLPADIAARVTGGDPRRDAPDGIIQSDVVKEVNRDGEVVWEWRAWEHLNPEDFPIHDIFDRRHWPMINGLSVTRDGLVLMSLRTTSGVIAVDKESGRLSGMQGRKS